MSVTGPDGTPDPVVLAEPVRQRLVQIASDVLGRLEPDEVPPALRAIARFTPSKRVRLGAAVLSAALDADPQFRDRVARAVIDATPQLVDAVGRGDATPASDPFDTATVAYLTRPDGWSDVVAGVSERWQQDRAAREAAAEDGARLRAELADLRARLKAETARADEAVAQAASSDEATHLRNTLRVRTGELRSAERAVQDARAELAQVRAESERAAAARALDQDTELARLRSRTADLERALENARRETRAGREVDDARLRLLVDTLTDAAAGIRRELALPPARLRPGDTVAAAAAGTASATVHEPADLDRLLDLPQVHVIVDGYNVTKTGYPELPLVDQRTRLLSSMAGVHARAGAEITVVFDGGTRPPAQPRTPRGVRVLFSAPDELADDLIRRLVAAEPSGRALVVVTTDQQIVTDVRAAGAWTVPSAVLLRRLG